MTQQIKEAWSSQWYERWNTLESMYDNSLEDNDAYMDWWPVTLAYIGRQIGNFEIFARAQSNDYFDKIKCIFDLEDKNDFIPLFDAFREKKLIIPRWQFTSLNLELLLGFENLATKS